MRAKVKCNSVTKQIYGEVANLTGVSDDNISENQSFAEATPRLDMEIMINNPKARDYFEPGKEYYLDFSKAS